jgi:hypothetical protein
MHTAQTKAPRIGSASDATKNNALRRERGGADCSGADGIGFTWWWTNDAAHAARAEKSNKAVMSVANR